MTTATDRILDYVRGIPEGVTLETMRKNLGFPAGTVSSRASMLKKRGLLKKSGRQWKAATPVDLATHYVLVVDRSGSMSFREPKTKRLIRNQIDVISKNEENRISIVDFYGGQVRRTHTVEKPPFDFTYFGSEGGTPLRDSVLEASTVLIGAPKRTVVLVLTDGCENASMANAAQFAQRIKERQDSGDWTFAFLVPKGQKCAMVEAGAPEGNVQEWDDIDEAERMATYSTISYETEIKTSGGMTRSSITYFQANLAAADNSLTLLRDVSSEVKCWTVADEQTIEDFLKDRRGCEFKEGRGFYEVMKREKSLKADRLLLLFDRRDGKVYADGQKTVRAICGYPEKDCALDPGNHGNFAILAQSKSSANATHRARILPRGTKVAYWADAVK